MGHIPATTWTLVSRVGSVPAMVHPCVSTPWEGELPTGAPTISVEALIAVVLDPVGVEETAQTFNIFELEEVGFTGHLE